MAFYYVSLFSIIPLGVAYGLLGLLYWGLARATRGARARTLILSLVGVIFLILPISEELWIAWNFAQACKQAGTFINKKFEVQGFYDSTRRSAYENTKRGGYRFVEQRSEDGKGVERVERADKDSASKALAWYVSQHPGKDVPSSVIYPMDEKTQIVVFPRTDEAWIVTKLDHPTARYHFRMPNSHARAGYRITKHEMVIVDTTTGDVPGRYTRFSRDAPWFYWGIKGDYSCDAPDRWPLTRGNFSIYRDVLQPVSK